MVNRNKIEKIMILLVLLAVLSFGEGVKNTQSESSQEQAGSTVKKKKIKEKQTESGNETKKTVSKKEQSQSQSGEKESSNGEKSSSVKERDTEDVRNTKSTDSETASEKSEKLDKSKKNEKHSQSQKDKKKKDDNQKKKAVVAEEKEIEGISKYKGAVHKFIATKDGKVLKNGTENIQHPTASLAKVMNLVVALDQIDKGNATLEDNVCFTPETANLKGSWLNVKAGDCFKLKDLLRAEIIYSANNAAYLVAHHIGKGNIENFINMMNQKAQELGMKNTKFHTPAGLPTSMTGKKMDVSTAYDMYLLGKKAIEDERIKEWSAEPQLVLLNSQSEEVIYKNRNMLLFRYGIYGLKTGFHAEAGYNLILTSKMGNLEIISVTLGNETEDARTRDQKSEFTLIEDRLKPVYIAGKNVGKFKVTNAKKKEIKGVISDNIYQIDNTEYKFHIKDLNVNADGTGIKKGDKVGEMEVYNNGHIMSRIDIVSEEDVESLSILGKFLRYVTFGWV